MRIEEAIESLDAWLKLDKEESFRLRVQPMARDGIAYISATVSYDCTNKTAVFFTLSDALLRAALLARRPLFLTKRTRDEEDNEHL